MYPTAGHTDDPATQAELRRPEPGRARRAVRFLLDLVVLSRPMLWPMVIVPFFGGYVLATRRFLPQGCLPFDGSACWNDGWRFLPVMLMGAMCWLFAFMINDIVDLQADQENPARASSPLVSGRMPLRGAQIATGVSAVVALAAGVLAGPAFAVLAAAAVVISWAYSAPPLRLKTRPGFDIAACSVAVGAVPVTVGYTLGMPLATLPWISPVAGTLYMVAIYVPTTIGDYEADLASGHNTVAVRFGRDTAYFIGFIAFTLACVIWVVLAWNDYIIPRTLLPMEIGAGLLAIVLYHRMLYKTYDAKAIVKGLAVIGVIAATTIAVFGADYVGWF